MRKYGVFEVYISIIATLALYVNTLVEWISLP